MSENLNGIDVFVAVAEAGGFAAAAQRLHLTRSAVTKIVARLEQRLDCRLFHRTTRTLALTEAGLVYHEHCVRALRELRDGKAALEAGRHEPVGRLRVSAPVLFGRQCVAPVLIALARRHPRLELDLSFSDRVVDVIGDGYDLAVRVGPLASTTALATRRLGTQRMAICAAPSYLAAHGRPAGPGDIAHHEGIMYGRAGSRRAWSVDTDGVISQAEPRCRIMLDDLQAILDAALDGAGLAWLPCWLAAQHIQRGALERLFDGGSVAATDTHLVWPHGRHLPARTRAAIDALAAEVPRQLNAD